MRLLDNRGQNTTSPLGKQGEKDGRETDAFENCPQPIQRCEDFWQGYAYNKDRGIVISRISPLPQRHAGSGQPTGSTANKVAPKTSEQAYAFFGKDILG
jgi:hypothetical protein